MYENPTEIVFIRKRFNWQERIARCRFTGVITVLDGNIIKMIKTSEIHKSAWFIDSMATQLQEGVATGMFIFNMTL